jgi:hypothetical protein
MEKKVLTQDEITKLKDLKQKFGQLTEIAGEIEIQVMNLELKKDSIKLSLQQLQQQEITLAKELEEKYGEGTISLESGEFLSNE